MFAASSPTTFSRRRKAAKEKPPTLAIARGLCRRLNQSFLQGAVYTLDNINDLIGDAAKQLMAQAGGIQNQRLKESAQRVALTVSAKTRDETIAKARNAAFARIPIWAFFLPVTRRQQIVLGRIYSFQCTTNKDGSPAEYRMSLSTGASELGMTNRAEMQKDLQRLISLGFITKRSNGARKPATYLVDEVVCVTEARHNGWDG